MRIGVTGHQDRPSIDWSWVRNEVRVEIQKLARASAALSSLAKGSDQIFARVAFDLGIPVVAVIPAADYEKHFRGEDRIEYERLLNRCEVVNLDYKGKDEEGFLEAGKYVANQSDVLFAIWDGKKSGGLGGTADIFDYAMNQRKRIVHINPITREIERHGEINNG